MPPWPWDDIDQNLQMVSSEAVRASNAQGDRIKDYVGVFVGGTGGIGEATLKELFRRTVRPKIYIVGRSEQKANAVIEDAKKLNPDGRAYFIQSDISLLRNVDELCKQLRQLEPKINGLFLTAGYMTLKGRVETDEGIDRKMSVNYYSRMRWVINLMPCLTRASELNELSRVNSVLAAGSEGDIRVDDLDLKHNFTLHAALAHCTVMTDFIMEEFAKRYPGTAFMHSYPGTVKTGIANELNGPIRLAVKVMYAVMTPWILNVQESGERHFFQLTSMCYPAARWKGTSCRGDGEMPGIPVHPQLDIMAGSDDVKGSGAYLLDWDSKPTGDEKVLGKYRDMDMGRKVWEHTMGILRQAGERGRRVEEQTEKFERLAAGDKRPAEDEGEGSGRPAPEDPIGWRPG